MAVVHSDNAVSLDLPCTVSHICPRHGIEKKLLPCFVDKDLGNRALQCEDIFFTLQCPVHPLHCPHPHQLGAAEKVMVPDHVNLVRGCLPAQCSASHLEECPAVYKKGQCLDKVDVGKMLPL
eukprot:g33301.t1